MGGLHVNGDDFHNAMVSSYQFGGAHMQNSVYEQGNTLEKAQFPHCTTETYSHVQLRASKSLPSLSHT